VPFVISGGRLASVDKPPTPGFARVMLSDTVGQDYADIWRTQPQVRTVVSFLARNIAQLGLHTYRRVTDIDRERVTEHPIARLMSRPNPFTTRYRSLEALVSDLAIYDNAVLVKAMVNGQPKSLVRASPSKVTVLGDDPFAPQGYEVRGNRGKRQFPPEQVVHFRGYSPTDVRWGVSPLETLRRILAEEYQAGQYREQLWRNQARTAGYLKRPLDAPEWSTPAKERFRSDWHAQYAGDGPRAGGTPILEDGMDFVPAASSARDAQYIEARKLTREEVASAYHIPLPMVGILEHATYSNIQEQHKQLYQDTLGPWLTMIAEDLALQLFDDFADTDRLYLEFNLAEKLRGSFEEQANQLQTSVGAPYMTRNEARARLNLPQLSEADGLVVPLNVLTGGQASPRDSAPAQSSAPARAKQGLSLSKARPEGYERRTEQVFATFFERQGKVIAAQLGAAKARRKATIEQVFDSERWQRELAGDLYPLDVGISTAAGRAALESLGLQPTDYDEDRTLAWHVAAADGIAVAMTKTTRARLADVLGDDDPQAAVTHLFEVYATARAAQLAASHVTGMAGFGSSEALRQTGREATKTWIVTSGNPRSSHALMDGETVGLDDNFSNGAAWPGDSALSEDERAGCACDMEMNFP
jgi:HK97 family phage portal protein